MTALRASFRTFIARTRDEHGASAVEYGLLVGLIAVAIIVAVTLLGDNLAIMFNNIANAI